MKSLSSIITTYLRLHNLSRLYLSISHWQVEDSTSQPGFFAGRIESAFNRAEQSRAEQSRAEQSRAEQSRAEQSRAEQSRAEQSRAEQSRAE
ncbi:hypothetical protein AOL_s00110g27 [Orbilia oligospora ATCC 24927]|uniref:Uncharacterized protein n=1 Tax=Arthrobotrys oligospora (strain ATCC 24927 / CBS 115.81 / DSM 1491) TaxID=756982 RepID=G1XKK7_ARTOA|nr:hypothetical protein AOL_s00110g27 [Orbilia oligospora ATCC 24927]EGX46203.1 hypothetical protein AOL_s00110g27 [Orbilia oligospora ATCC 24927]